MNSNYQPLPRIPHYVQFPTGYYRPCDCPASDDHPDWQAQAFYAWERGLSEDEYIAEGCVRMIVLHRLRQLQVPQHIHDYISKLTSEWIYGQDLQQHYREQQQAAYNFSNRPTNKLWPPK